MGRLIFFLTASCFLLLPSSFAHANSQTVGNTYTNNDEGFSIEKPGGWTFKNYAHTAKLELTNGTETTSRKMNIFIAFEDTLRNGEKPFCIVDETHTKLKDPLAYLTKDMESTAKKNKGFKFIEETHSETINGITTSHVAYSSLVDERRSVEHSWEAWYFMGNQKMIRLECTISATLFGSVTSDFKKISQTLKKL